MLSLRQNLRLSLRGSSAAVLSLDFLSATSLDARITFTRGSSATRVNASGLIESVSSNVARFDYDPVTLAAKGLLIEEQRTNLLTYSAEFDNAAWTKANTTVTANNTASPDGTTSADLILETTATAEHSVYNGNVTTSAGAVTASVFVKASGRNWIAIRETLVDGTTYVNTFFNVATGTVGTVAAGRTATITNYNNGWYRCTVTATSTGGSRFVAVNLSTDGSTISYAGVATLGIYLWGAQLEAGAFATSYIPTVASTVTRSADVATMTGTNFSSWYNQSAGTFVVGADSFGSGSNRFVISTSNNTNAERIVLFATAAAALRGIVTDGNVTQADATLGGFSANTTHKSAYAFAANSFNMALDGVVGADDTAGTLPTPDQLYIGLDATGAAPINGHIRSIAYYNTRLPNAALQGLTA